VTAMAPIDNSQPYGGWHNVYMGNGDSMSVTHIGNLSLSLGSSTFTLQNVFNIPPIHKNLLSVAHFTKDIYVFFLFAPDYIKSIAYALDVYCFRAPVKMVYTHLICHASLLHKPLLPFIPPSGTIIWVIRHQMSSQV